MTPSILANYCLKFRKQNVSINILDKKELQKVKANSLLSVGKGSSNSPKMVTMEWKGSSENPNILIGKGICYDSGGLNLKTSHLTEMKWNKATSGVVIEVIDIISKLKLPVHVIEIIVLAKNMPDGNSMKLGDVITSLLGKTIEIIDTDCEGRLVLADSISYAQKYYSPKTLIDLATLSMGTIHALRSEYAGLFTYDDVLAKQLIKAGLESNEKLWRLPLGQCYSNHFSSEIAD